MEDVEKVKSVPYMPKKTSLVLLIDVEPCQKYTLMEVFSDQRFSPYEPDGTVTVQ